MGKVASSSIYSSLKGENFVVYHMHRLSKQNIEEVHKSQIEKKGFVDSKAVDQRGIRLYNMFLKKDKRPIYIISLVRNPIERNMSAFFQNKEYFTKNLNHSNSEELTKLFFDLYDHETPLYWFDKEFKRCLGIDIYKSPFPKEKRYKTVKSGNLNILLMRVDLNDDKKEEVINNFLGITSFKLKNKNVGTEKSYNNEYKEFKKRINLNESYIRKMLNSKFTSYFYSDNEILEFKEKWL